MIKNSNPIIIQGGMGAGVSSWPLARAVSKMGQLGVVSGTALDLVLARRLQLGDKDGHLRRAMAKFPFPEMAERILDRYFIEGGKAPHRPFRSPQRPSDKPSQRQLDLLIVSNFVEVLLAKEDHDGLIGINFLEKIQPPTLPSLYGAMLADVDYVLMGAGIPRTIPGILDLLSQGKAVEMPLSVVGADRNDHFAMHFDPQAVCNGAAPETKRPKFLAIIASTTLATMLKRKSTGRVDGFVVEGPTAGGHNAPPRGALKLNDRGEPIYGDRDKVDNKAMQAIGLPFWLAGSYGHPQRVLEALNEGASGVQVGTAFAFCNESGIDPDIKRKVLEMSRDGTVEVMTDPVASPTGFPLKVLRFPGSVSEGQNYEDRHRVCDLGYLRHAYKKEDGSLGWRCPSDKVNIYVSKGGDAADTQGRKCICNGLLATIGMGQVRDGGDRMEQPLVTSGDEVRNIARIFLSADCNSYAARDVINYLLSGVEVTHHRVNVHSNTHSVSPSNGNGQIQSTTPGSSILK